MYLFYCISQYHFNVSEQYSIIRYYVYWTAKFRKCLNSNQIRSYSRSKASKSVSTNNSAKEGGTGLNTNPTPLRNNQKKKKDKASTISETTNSNSESNSSTRISTGSYVSHSAAKSYKEALATDSSKKKTKNVPPAFAEPKVSNKPIDITLLKEMVSP